MLDGYKTAREPTCPLREHYTVKFELCNGRKKCPETRPCYIEMN